MICYASRVRCTNCQQCQDLSETFFGSGVVRRFVDDNRLQRRGFGIPRLRLESLLGLRITGEPSRADACAAEVDVFGVISRSGRAVVIR